MADKPLQDLVARLERERADADRRYNDALTALDAAVQAAAGAAPSPREAAPYDPSQLPRVNDAWNILGGDTTPVPAAGLGAPLKSRLRAFIWRVVGPVFERQQQFNAALVDHLNRNVKAHDDARVALAELGSQVAALGRREDDVRRALVAYLQTVTEYVDSRDRAVGGADLREQIVLANERAMALQREMHALRARVSGHREPVADAAAATQPAVTPEDGGPAPGADFSYVGFEDRFRGSQEMIRARLADYVPVFRDRVGGGLEGEKGSAPTHPVLDVGCGRGELLSLLTEAGVPVRGIDVNAEMVALCRERGFDAERADAVTYLESLPDASLGGLAAIQVVEHLEPAYLSRFLAAAFHKLRPGAPLVLETINPACWMAFFEAYLRDLTHAQPLHPDTLRYLVQASGFSSVDVQYRSPVSGEDRLDRVDGEVGSDVPPALRETMAAVNAHADKLNARLFSSMDYAVVGRR